VVLVEVQLTTSAVTPSSDTSPKISASASAGVMLGSVKVVPPKALVAVSAGCR
jgi:hypothetical protein